MAQAAVALHAEKDAIPATTLSSIAPIFLTCNIAVFLNPVFGSKNSNGCVFQQTLTLMPDGDYSLGTKHIRLRGNKSTLCGISTRSWTLRYSGCR